MTRFLARLAALAGCLQWAGAADILGKREEFWSCAADEPRWHWMREAVRFVMWEEQPPLKTSMERLSGLLPLWTNISTGVDNVSKVAADSPCPTGEVFFMLLHFIMASMEKIRKESALDVSVLVGTLGILKVRIPSVTAALSSSWPIFGILTLAQQKLLRLGLGNAPPPERRGPLTDSVTPFAEALSPYAHVCSDGEELQARLQAWLEAPIPRDGPSLPPLSAETRMLAWRLGQRLASDPSLCAGDAVVRAAARVVASGILPEVPWTISIDGQNATGWRWALQRLVTLLDHSLLSVGGWNKLVYTGWPLLAVLHRLQEAYVREAVCSMAERNAYGLISRSSPESVWLCIRRSTDIVEERWRMHGEFPDCVDIANAMKDATSSDCLFADIGANLGSCALMLARRGMEVLAVEPVPVTARLFKAAVLRNGLERSITVVQAAVGREAGTEGEIHCPGGHSAVCRVLPRQSAPASGKDAGSAPPLVSTVSVDSLLEASTSSRRLCAVKIDVEGAEEEVVLGGLKTLQSKKPMLFLELHPYELRARGSSSGRLIDRLFELGYQVVAPLEEARHSACMCFGAESCNSPAYVSALTPDGGGGIRGNGTYAKSRWLGAEALKWDGGREAVLETPEACACARACWRNLRPGDTDGGCRCWDYEVGLRRCSLYQRCSPGSGSKPGTELAENNPGWWAGELNGILRISTG